MVLQTPQPISGHAHQSVSIDLCAAEPFTSKQKKVLFSSSTKNMEGKGVLPTDDAACSDRERCRETALKTSVSFQKEIHKPWYLVTGYSAECISVVDDLSKFYPISDIFRLRVTQPESSNQGNLGILSADKIMLGYIGSCRGYLGYQQASQKNDGWGMLYGKIKIVRGVCSMVNGVIALPFNALCMAATRTAFNVDALSRAILKGIGFSLSALSKGLLFFLLSAELTKGVRLSVDLNTCMADPDPKIGLRSAMECILGKVDLNREEREAIARAVLSGEMEQQAIECNAEDEKLLTDCDREYARKIARDAHPEDEECDVTDIEQMERQIKQRFVLEKKRKQAEFGRRVGEDVLELVLNEMSKPKTEQFLNCEANDLNTKEAQSLVNEIRKQVRFDCYLKAIAATFFLLGMVGTCLSLFGTGGIVGIVGTTFGTTTALGGLAFDLYSLLQKVKKNSELSTQDRAMLALFILLATTSATLEGVFAATPVPLMVSSGISLLWGGSALYHYHAISHSELEDGSMNNDEIYKVRAETHRCLFLKMRENKVA